MYRTMILWGGILAYAGFLGTMSYLMAFMAGIRLPWGIDTGQPGSPGMALLVNTALVSVFALQHAVMARDAFKARWTRIVPVAFERSTFVIATCLCLVLLFSQWRAIPSVCWDVSTPWLRVLIWCLFGMGIAIVLYTSFLIDHFDLFGLRQVWLHYRGIGYTPVKFSARSLYRYVRHPMMLGFLLTLWCVPTMSFGHLQFTVLMTAYLLVGIHMEERSLLRKLGDAYRGYYERTPMLIPRPFGRRGDRAGMEAAVGSKSRAT